MDQDTNNTAPFIRPDYSRFAFGWRIKDGMLISGKGDNLGEVPTKEFKTLEEYKKVLLKAIEDQEIFIEDNDELLSIPTLEKKFSLLADECVGLGAVPQPVLWEEINNKVFSEERWRIKNLLPLEGITIIASPSGEKKTFLALSMAYSIANGTPFLNDSRFPTIPGNVLYIDLEMPEAELQRRARNMGFNDTKYKIWILNKELLNLNTDKNADWLLQFVQEKEIKAVFVDTFRPAAGGIDEGKAELIRPFFNRFKAFKNNGTDITFLDHCRKPHPFEGRTPKKEQLLGSQDKCASVEVLLMVRSEDGSNTIDVHQKKNRLGTELQPFTVLMNDELDSNGDVNKTKLTYGGKVEEKQSKLDTAKEFILDTLVLEGGMVRQKIITLAYDEKKIGERNMSEALRELENSGDIKMKKVGRENYYYFPEEEVAPAESLPTQLPMDESKMIDSS